MTEDKIQEQLTDAGAVIGYRPDLQYSKSMPTDGNIPSITNLEGNYSQTVKSFLENLPSAVIIDLADTISDIDGSIDRLTEELNNKQQIMLTDIVPSTQIPNVISILNDEKTRLTKISDTLKNIYYGSSTISDEGCQAIDDSLVSKITNADKSGTGVNYLTLSYDTLQLKSVMLYSSKIDAAVLQLEDAVDTIDDTKVTDKSLIDNINSLYKETDEELNDRINTYNLQQSADTAVKTLYNYYLKRKDLNQYYSRVLPYLSDGNYLASKIEKYDIDTKQSVEEINRTMLGNVYYINSIKELVAEKQHLIGLCVTLSYN